MNIAEHCPKIPYHQQQNQQPTPVYTDFDTKYPANTETTSHNTPPIELMQLCRLALLLAPLLTL
jgi:hypothetical protein